MGATRDKIETLFWGKPPADPKERKLLIKLDAIILSYVCLSYFSPLSSAELMRTLGADTASQSTMSTVPTSAT